MDLKSRINRILWKHDNMTTRNPVTKANEENSVWISRRFDVDTVWWRLTRNSAVWWPFCNTCPSLSVWATVVFYLSYFGLLKPETKHARSFVIYDLFYMYWRCDPWVMSPSLHAAWPGTTIPVVSNLSINITNS